MRSFLDNTIDIEMLDISKDANKNYVVLGNNFTDMGININDENFINSSNSKVKYLIKCYTQKEKELTLSLTRV